MTVECFHLWPSSSPDSNKSVGEFVSRGIFGFPDGFEKYSTAAISLNGKLIAGIVYHNYHPKEGVIELSAFSLSKRWLTKKTIYSILNEPFVSLGCQMLIFRTSSKNDKMLKINRGLGFSEILLPRMRGKNEDEFLFTLTDDDWKSSKYYAQVAR